MSTLILFLPAAAPGTTTGYDYALTSDGRTLTGHASVPATLLPEGQRGGEVVAVVPAQRLSWHSVDLPKGVGPGSARLRVVLESLLEDRLLDEPSQLHLALAPHASAGRPSWVAVCDKTWLRDHVHALEAAGRPVTRIVPELAPDNGPTRLLAVGEPDQPLLLATGHAIGGGVLAVPLTHASLALLPREPLAPDGKIPALSGAVIEAEPAVAGLAEQLLHHAPSLRQHPERMLRAATTTWDLAQFDLASSVHSRRLKHLRALGNNLRRSPTWRPARWGAGILVAANLIGLNAWAWREQTALETRRAAIRNTLTQTFPSVQVVVDAPLQMEREVVALRQNTGTASGRDLESMLSALGTALPGGAGANAITFNAGEVRVKGLPVNSPELPNLAGRLRAQGYLARLEADALVLQQDTTP